MDFSTRTENGSDKIVQQKSDLGVQKGTHESGDGTKLFRSGAFDPGPKPTSEMHTRESARARAVKTGGTGEAVEPIRNQ